MIFSSPAFLLFFAIFYSIHLASPKSIRLFIIIVGSTVFYSCWNIALAWIPHFLAATTFFGTHWLEKAKSDIHKKWRLGLIVVLLLFPLVFFKYTNFLYQAILNVHDKPLDLFLPLGISFVTFSLIAYVAEVYKKNYPAEQKISHVLAYTLFFPHLIAGPILKPWELIPQFERLTKAFNAKRLIYGGTLFSVGMAKKLVFADPLGNAIQSIYASPAGLSSAQYLFALYAFPVQIYSDFSGYTDMAMGLAFILGIRLPNNFMQPFAATSIIDFWRRWHISLSAWLKDYIYIPMGGNRKGLPRQSINLLTTMAVSGIWHGAGWGYLVWGCSHGFFIVVNHGIRKLRLPSIPSFIKTLIVFHLVALMWIFFRATDMHAGWLIFTGIFSSAVQMPSGFLQDNIFYLILIAVFFILHRFDDHRRFYWFSRQNFTMRVLPVLIFLWLISIAISVGKSAKFIYFDF